MASTATFREEEWEKSDLRCRLFLSHFVTLSARFIPTMRWSPTESSQNCRLLPKDAFLGLFINKTVSSGISNTLIVILKKSRHTLLQCNRISCGVAASSPVSSPLPSPPLPPHASPRSLNGPHRL